MAEWTRGMLLIFSCGITLTWGVDHCPEKCSCTVSAEWTLLLNCSRSQLKEFPSSEHLLDFQLERMSESAGSGLSVEIDLSHNAIERARFPSAIGNVTRIDLSRNDLASLKEVHVEEASTLEELNLSHNRLLEKVTADVRNERLEVVNFSFCGIAELEDGFFEGLPSVRVVDLSYNSLTELRALGGRRNGSGSESSDWRPLAVTHLNLSHNHLARINGKDLADSRIKVLDISANNVAHANLFLRQLEQMNASNNLLESAKGLTLPNILDLDLSNNRLADVHVDFTKKMPRLRILNLSRNPIGQLQQVKSFSILVLDLSFCRIERIRENAFSTLIDLELLNLAGNRLTALDGSFAMDTKNVANLFLGQNPWECNCSSQEFQILHRFVVNRGFGGEGGGDLLCRDTAATWSDACRDAPNEEELHLAKRGMFYAMLSVVVSLAVVLSLFLCYKYLRNVRHHASLHLDRGITVEEGSDSDLRRDTESADREGESIRRGVSVRRSTPPPNYEAAMSLPVLTEEEGEKALSSLSLNKELKS